MEADLDTEVRKPHFKMVFKQDPDASTLGLFIFMIENYDDLTWDISDTPVGFSTPDELFEYSHNAETACPECGNVITGTAQYWSRDEDGTSSWLERIYYEPCECTKEEDEEDDDYDEKDDKLMDEYFKNIS